MKKLLEICFTFCFISAFSQRNNEDTHKKLIDSALALRASNVYYYYYYYNKDLNKNIKTENWTRHLNNLKYIINNTYVIDENLYPVKLDAVKSTIPLKTIDIKNPKNKKLLKKGIDVWKIIPILYGNQLKIVIIDFKVSYKNKLYNFDNGGGSNIIFEYSCNDKKWKLISEEHTGN